MVEKKSRAGCNVDKCLPSLFCLCVPFKLALSEKGFSPPLGFLLEMNIKNNVGSEMMRKMLCTDLQNQ